LKIVFMGTADFSAAVFEKLNGAHGVCAVVTSPDKPVGRGHKLQAAALKIAAVKAGVPVMQYDRVSRDGLDDIISLAPDIVVTAAFGQILSEKFLEVPKYGVLNVHASLLPKYRGASPIQQAVIDGEKETGVTIMRTVKAVDAGDLILQKSLRIGDKETAGELFGRLAELGGEMISDVISLIESGRAQFTPQDHSLASFCRMIKKSDGLIDFSKSAEELDCFVRGMTPWPSAYTSLNGKTLKVFDIEKACDGQLCHLIAESGSAVGNDCEMSFGTVIAADAKKGLIVKTGGSAVRLREVQLEGSKRMTDSDFLKGHTVEIGARLGE